MFTEPVSETSWRFFKIFYQQALDVNKKLNCCTGILLESLDQLKTISSNKEGLLYGVPISIKDNIAYKVFCSYALSNSFQDGSYTDRVPKYSVSLRILWSRKLCIL